MQTGKTKKTMKAKLLSILLCTTAFAAGSCSFDDTDIVNRLAEHEQRLQTLEQTLKNAQENIVLLHRLVLAAQDANYIESVEPVKDEAGDTIGYTVTFGDGYRATIYHGDKGENGPVPSVVHDEQDGNYYWVVYYDGQDEPTYLLDKDGNRIKANGTDAVPPQVKIDAGTKHWLVSTDGGKTWKDTGVVAEGKDGDAYFQHVAVDDSYVTFTLMNGTEITLPVMGQGFVFNVGRTDVKLPYGGKAEIEVTMKNVADTFLSTVYGWDAVLEGNILKITAPTAQMTEAKREGVVSIIAFNANGLSKIAKVAVSIGEDEVTDLNADHAYANCYIVSAPGVKYRFDATVQGTGIATANLVPVKMEPASAQLLWATAPGLVNGVELNDGKISFFTAAGNALTAGSAVIAAKDAAGEILWSWHIWVTDYDPETANDRWMPSGNVLMNRNLGAENNTPGDFGSVGLTYQWGRKDPFVNASSYTVGDAAYRTVYDGNGAEVIDWMSAAGWESVESSPETGTVAYSVKNPTRAVRISQLAAENWIYADLSLPVEDILAARKASGEFDLWGATRNQLGQKTIYDPCPKGWKVASQNTFATLEDNGSKLAYTQLYAKTLTATNFNKTLHGTMLCFDPDDPSKTSWFPFTGYVAPQTMVISSFLGTYGRLWTDGAETQYYRYGAYRMHLASTAALLSSQSTATLLPLRCMKVE